MNENSETETGAPRAFKYKAFISYSWNDRRATERLHRAIESFRTPKDLIGKLTPHGPAPPRLAPVFKDREEEPAGSNLRGVIEAALDQSEFLVVVCSPSSAKSKWVNKEIAYFRKRRDPARVLPYIIEGEPGASALPGREGEECFAPALLFESSLDGAVSTEAIEAPLAADERKSGDGVRMATLKIIAGILGVGLDALARREAQRRARRSRILLVLASTIAAAMSGLSIYAFHQRDIADAQRAIADKERDTANSALEFLVSIFNLANPATENPKTITALTILDRGKEQVDADLVNQPEVQAKLLGALGAVYQNLGDIDEAERLLSRAVAVPKAALADRLAAELQLSWIALKRRDLGPAAERLDRIEKAVSTADGSLAGYVVDEARLELLKQRAHHAYLSGDLARATDLYTQAIDKIDPARPDAANLSATLASNRGLIRVARREFEGGLEDLTRARALFNDLYGPRHLLTAKATHNIAYAAFEARNFDAAISTMQEALNVYEAVLDPDHPDLATARKLYGTMLIEAGKPDLAIAPLESAANSFAAAYGATYYDAGYSLVYLALAYAQAGRPNEALGAVNRAETIYKANFEPGGFDFGDLLVYRGIVLGLGGARAKAAAFCAQGLEILIANLGPDDPYVKDMSGRCEAALGPDNR